MTKPHPLKDPFHPLFAPSFVQHYSDLSSFFPLSLPRIFRLTVVELFLISIFFTTVVASALQLLTAAQPAQRLQPDVPGLLLSTVLTQHQGTAFTHTILGILEGHMTRVVLMESRQKIVKNLMLHGRGRFFVRFFPESWDSWGALFGDVVFSVFLAGLSSCILLVLPFFTKA